MKTVRPVDTLKVLSHSLIYEKGEAFIFIDIESLVEMDLVKTIHPFRLKEKKLPVKGISSSFANQLKMKRLKVTDTTYELYSVVVEFFDSTKLEFYYFDKNLAQETSDILSSYFHTSHK